MPWQFTFEGEVYREVDLTLEALDRLMGVSGLSWGQIVQPLQSPSAAWGTVAALHSERTGQPFDDVAGRLKVMRWEQFMDLYERVAEDTPTSYEDGLPHPAAETSTDS